jgi:CopG-like RHH_1 or ribbon-helix-helix domain, RHH_5
MNTNENMSGRVNVVLQDEIYELLKGLAEAERRSQSQTAALLIEEALTARNLIKNTSTTLKGKNDP